MNLSEQGNMLTETSSGENVGEAKRGLSGFDLGIGNIFRSHTPYESSCVGTNESSSIVAQSDVSGADLLLAFDSISVSERLKPKDGPGTECISVEGLDHIGQAHMSEQRFDSAKDTCKYNFSDLATVAESSGHGGAASEVFDGVDESCKLNDPLIVYRSLRRSAFNSKINQKRSRKTSKCRRIASGNLGVNLDFLQMSRKSRSSCSKRAESFVWGYAGNILPNSEEDRKTDLNLDIEKKLTETECGKGKRNSLRDQMGQQSMGKGFIPTGRISLKIKIGNKICGMNNATESVPPTIKDSPELYDSFDNKLQEVQPEVVLPPHERNLEKVISPATYASSTKLEASIAFDKLSFSSSSNCHHVTSTEDQAASENIRSDVGTSPDSEVINPVLSVPLCDKGLPDLQESAIMSMAFVSPSAMSDHILSPKKSKKGGQQDKSHLPAKCTLKIRVPGAGSLNNAKVPISKGDDSSLSIPQAKSKKGKMKQNLTNCVGAASYCVPAATVVASDSKDCNKSVPSSSGLNFTKHFRGKGGSRNRSRTMDLSKKKDKTSKRKGNVNNASVEHQEDEKIGDSGVFVGSQTLSDHGESGAWKFASSTVREQYMLRNAWVLCDECEKWRRIPAKLADQIEETNCGWTCKENTDRNFADCSIPQEKSNSEINEELEISEASCEEDAGDTILKSNKNRPKVPQQSSWSLIKSNLLLHRSRKTQTIDEVMVCHCKPPSDGKLGCGAKCLNRMLNIECVQGTCPCGELCSNQQFQKRNYAKLKWFKCGKKGYGLQALKDISNGQFLIEYVGEILDMHAYESRQREYAVNGHRHFYFMTLNGSEVIDACAKGNLARFINHSCSPNCRTEKWMVNGEVCVGLFALRDIKKGEEVTFDYNYVRVFGAAAKKCVCGSSNCRGYIGGDPTNSEVIVQGDSDEEFSEPLMTCGDRELNEDWEDIMLTSSNGGENDIANKGQENRFNMKKLMSTDGEGIIDLRTHETLTQRVEGPCPAQVKKYVVRDALEVGSSAADDSVERLGTNKVNGESSKGSISANLKADGDVLQSQIHLPSKLIDNSLHEDGISGKAIPSVPGSSAVMSPSKSLSDTIESKRKLKYAAEGGRGELAMPNSFAKTKRMSSSVRKGKPKSKVIHYEGTPDLDKFNAALNRSKKLPELSLNSQFEAVKEKLNELLEPDGGISKRGDASRGYLKLLILTAASGNNGHGEFIESNRDLSMILDALLKTKSRTVLVDIINQNGLQMLHNIMKRYRKDYNKTPVLRKLLKVLEHLALRGILTLEHITHGPPCVGVESFKDSILIFTEHKDRQVHKIARNFRDRWIPRPLRKNYCMGRGNGRREVNHHSNYGELSRPTDCPGDKGVKPPEVLCHRQNSNLDPSSVSSGRSGTKRKSRWDIPAAQYPNSRTRINDDDTPPGFSPSCISNRHHENPHNVFLGDPQRRFAAHMPVSYGVPYSVKQQVGARIERSEVAPAVPFLPFPPLPPYTRGEQDTPTAKYMLMNKENAEYSGQNHTRTCSSSSPKNYISNHRPDGDSGSLGRKYFRQQKWSHSKLAPPWVRMRND